MKQITIIGILSILACHKPAPQQVAKPLLTEQQRIHAYMDSSYKSQFIKYLANDNHITKQITDERGLTSVQFVQDGKEWGLDYLTPSQLDSLKKALQ